MVQAPRGTRDFAPEEMEPRRRLEGLFRRVASRWGYREIQTPAFEELELFTARSGPDIVRSPCGGGGAMPPLPRRGRPPPPPRLLQRVVRSA